MLILVVNHDNEKGRISEDYDREMEIVGRVKEHQKQEVETFNVTEQVSSSELLYI